MYGADSDPTSGTIESGVKLLKLEIPKFDGNLLNWRVFWEQFKVYVHAQTQHTVPDHEKLVYFIALSRLCEGWLSKRHHALKVSQDQVNSTQKPLKVYIVYVQELTGHVSLTKLI